VHNAVVSDSDDDRPRAQSAWKPSPRERPWYRKLAAQRLAEAEVQTPDGTTYIVRVVRNAPIVGLTDAATSGNPIRRQRQHFPRAS
jgi:hypothetical protein